MRNKKTHCEITVRFLYNETPAIVAGVHKGFADEQKANRKLAKKVLVSKAPFTQGRLFSTSRKVSAWAFDIPMSKVPLRCFCHNMVWGISVLLNISLFGSNSGKQSKK